MNEQTPPGGNPRKAKPPSADRPHPRRFGEIVVPRPPDDHGPIPLADDAPPPPRRQSAAEHEAIMLASAVCPSCESNFPPEAILCINCGFDRRTRARVNAPPPRKKAKPAPEIATVDCPKCGYNLAGLTTSTCPECGQEFTPALLNRHAKRKNAGRAQLQLWVTPTVLLAIGSTICIGYVAKLGGGIIAVVWAINTSFSLLGGFCGYALVAANLTGWSYSIGNSLLRISAILFIATTAAIFIPVPSFILSIVMIWIIICVLLMSMMDMDYQDAGNTSSCVMLGWIIGTFTGGFIISRFI